MKNKELYKLASLFVDVFEVGERKAERDIADDVLSYFDIDLHSIEKAFSLQRDGNIPDPQDRLVFRKHISELLAQKAKSVEELVSIVMLSGAKFIEMVEEIYAFLSDYETTTHGTNEEFKFRMDEVVLDISLSPAFIETLHSYKKLLTTMQIGKIDSDKLNEFLGMDREFYGEFPLREGFIDETKSMKVPRNIGYLPWIKEELELRMKQEQIWSTALEAFHTLDDAVKGFVDNALFLVSAHIKRLEDHEDNDLNDFYGKNEKYQREGRETERSIYEQTGLLHGWLLANRVGVLEEPSIEQILKESNTEQILYVSTKKLLETPNCMGAASDCIVVLDENVVPYFYGTAIGGLASLCGLWKAGIKRKPYDSSEIFETFNSNDLPKVIEWLNEFRHFVSKAAEWLKDDVWQPMKDIETLSVVKIAEQFFNLPLWRERWLLYEIWLTCTVIKCITRNKWSCKLALKDAGTGGNFWELSKDPASSPCGTITLLSLPHTKLEVWYQSGHLRNSVNITPDISIRTPGMAGRDLVIIEGKDRFRMTTMSKKDGALSIGQRYSKVSGAIVTWVVNYGRYKGREIDNHLKNHGDAWCGLFFGQETKPGNMPKNFEATIIAALLPLEYRKLDSPLFIPKHLIFVIDTTSSMHPHIANIWAQFKTISKIPMFQKRFDSFGAILFGDHEQGQPEPYLIRKIEQHSSIAALEEAVMREPLTHGGDVPEALEDAINECRNTIDELGTPLHFIVITDALPHSVDECPNGIDFQSEVNQLLASGSFCTVVNNWLKQRAYWEPFEENVRFQWLDIFDDLKVDEWIISLENL